MLWLSSQPAFKAIFSRYARFALAGVLGVFMAQCTSTPKSEVVVSVKDQKLGVYENGHLKKKYAISTSKFGLGDKPNSYCTPLGKHEVIAKIGHGLPKGAVLKSRSWNGEVLPPNAPGRDPIVSRILWLRGMENTNRNAQRRFIYIHGTTEEFNLGKPASYGCIRMGMGDVVEVFEEVGIGAKVEITKGKLPRGGALEDAVPAEEALVAATPKPDDAKAAEAKAGDAKAQPAVAPDSNPTDGKVAKAPAESKTQLGKTNGVAEAAKTETKVAKGKDREKSEGETVAKVPTSAKSKKTKLNPPAPEQIRIGPEAPAKKKVAGPAAEAKAEGKPTGLFSFLR